MSSISFFCPCFLLFFCVPFTTLLSIFSRSDTFPMSVSSCNNNHQHTELSRTNLCFFSHIRTVFSNGEIEVLKWETSLAVVGSSGEATVHGYNSKTSETEGVEGRPFAMMAAPGLDMLWIRSSFSLFFLVIAACADQTGMSAVFLVSQCNTFSTHCKWNVAVFCAIVG